MPAPKWRLRSVAAVAVLRIIVAVGAVVPAVAVDVVVPLNVEIADGATIIDVAPELEVGRLGAVAARAGIHAAGGDALHLDDPATVDVGMGDGEHPAAAITATITAVALTITPVALAIAA